MFYKNYIKSIKCYFDFLICVVRVMTWRRIVCALYPFPVHNVTSRWKLWCLCPTKGKCFV